MDPDDYDVAIGTGVDTTLSGLEERRPLTLLQLPGEGGDISMHSSMSDLGSPIYERRSRHDIVSRIIISLQNVEHFTPTSSSSSKIKWLNEQLWRGAHVPLDSPVDAYFYRIESRARIRALQHCPLFRIPFHSFRIRKKQSGPAWLARRIKILIHHVSFFFFCFLIFLFQTRWLDCTNARVKVV